MSNPSGEEPVDRSPRVDRSGGESADEASRVALGRAAVVARRVRAAGGRALIVGGAARDRILGRPSKDLDLEIFGLAADEVRILLSEFGATREVGRSFPVFLVAGWSIDFALPRTEVAREAGDDFASAYEAAARRRDLTINAIAIDPLTDACLDPLRGRRDLEAGVLREADARHFGEDPLRGLRVARFAAAFEMEVAPSLRRLCLTLDLSAVPGERLLGELERILLATARPSLGFHFLQEHAASLMSFAPELTALVGVPQEPRWHPEGCVFTHTCMVLDAAAALRGDEAPVGRDGRAELAELEDDVAAVEPTDALTVLQAQRALMWAALCHDLGKPLVTTTDEGGRVRAFGHSQAGVEPTRALLGRLRAPNVLIEAVAALVEHHLAPFEFVRGKAGARAYRRLARKLAASGVSMQLLARVARADALGRTTEEALAGRVPDCDAFEAKAASLGLEVSAEADVVLGRDLLERGFEPGPEIGRLLARCREVQDETGWRDAGAILERVLARPNPSVTRSRVTRSVTQESDTPASETRTKTGTESEHGIEQGIEQGIEHGSDRGIEHGSGIENGDDDRGE